jgi:hypothetical protein
MIIAFTGGIGVGKDTAAKYMIKVGKAFTRVNFDDTLKAIQEDAYRHLTPVYRRKAGFTSDPALIGTLSAWGKNLSPTLWTDLWRDRAEFERKVYDIVCSDCFFDNQAYAVRALNGYIVEIRRPGASDGFVDKMKVDFVVDNDGSLEVFYKRLDELLNQIVDREQSKGKMIHGI